MITYSYVCILCDDSFDRAYEISDRYKPTEEPCRNCGLMGVRKRMGNGGFKVPEGSCGNAKNGYSSYHGDSVNFKAGRKVYK